MKTNELEDDRATAFRPSDDRSTVQKPADDRSTAGKPSSGKSIDITGQLIDGYQIENRLNGDMSSQSQLYLASKDGKQYAFKIYKPGFNLEPRVADFLLNKNTSPFVIKVYYKGLYNGQEFYVMDYYKNGSVVNHFMKYQELAGNINAFKIRVVQQLNEGLHYIHTHNVLHWDIKPLNILVSDDFTTLIITDFGSADYSPNGQPKKKRADPKKFTEAYLAPEGEGQLSPAVDYYALGVTIMEMAHGGYVPGNLDLNETASWFIPRNVPMQIQALVEKLREFEAKRIGYEGVKKWIKDPDNTYQISGDHIEKDRLARYYLNLGGTRIDDIGETAIDTGDFVKKLQANWPVARTLFTSGVMKYMLSNASDYDGEKSDILDLFQKYKNDPDLGLLFVFLKLDPDSEFVYINKNYHDIKTYMEGFLGKNICEFFNYEYLHERVIAEGSTSLSKIEKIHELANESKKANLYGADNYELVSWYNLCSGSNIAFIDNKKIVVLPDLVKIEDYLFNGKLEPASLDFVFEPEFLETFLNKIKNSPDYAEKEAKLKEIWNIRDCFKRNAKLALFLTNQIRFNFEGTVIGDMMQFVAFTVETVKKDDRKTMNMIGELIKSGRLAEWYELLPGVNNEVLKFLKDSIKTKRDNIDLVITFKNKASSDSKSFLFDNRIFNSMQDVFNYLAASSNLSLTCKRLMQDEEFLAWLDRMGFTDAKDEIQKLI